MKLVRQDYMGAKEVWVCDDCYKKEHSAPKQTHQRGLVQVASDSHYDPENDAVLCEYCKKPLVSLNVLKKRGKIDKEEARKKIKDHVQSIYHFMKLVSKMKVGEPCVLRWKRKWVACVPLQISYNEKFPLVRLGIIARNPARQWGDSYLAFGSRMPLTVEPLKEEDIPLMLGENEGDWMSKVMKRDLDEQPTPTVTISD